MDFREFAIKETTDLVDRLAKAASAGAQAAAQRVSDEAKVRLDAVQAELKARTDRVAHLETNLVAAERARQDLQGVCDKLRVESQAATERLQKQLDAAQQQLRSDAQAAEQKLRQQTEAAEKLRGDVQAAEQKLRQQADASEKQRADAKAAEQKLREQLEAAQKQLRSDAEAAERQLRQQTSSIEQLRRELEEARRQLQQQTEAARQQLQQQADAAQQLRQQLDTAQQKLRADAQAAQAAQEKLRQDAHIAQEKVRQELQSKIDAAVSAQARAAEQAKTTDAQLRAARAHAEAARAELDAAKAEVASADGQMERLLISFETLAAAATISDLLIALADCLGGEFERVALFRLKGNKLQGEYQTGFDSGTDVAKVVIPLSMDSLLARAVSSGCIEMMESDNPDSARVPLGGKPACALALPVAAGGETLGILYADDGAEGVTSDTTGARGLKGRFAELVLRHAVALALRLTAELRTIAELRGHAQRLLNHAEEMYAADLEAGVAAADLHARLLENVECARRLYAQRVAIEGPAAAGLLEEQLVLLVEDRAGTPFGRDLAAVAASEGAQRAEAS